MGHRQLKDARNVSPRQQVLRRLDAVGRPAAGDKVGRRLHVNSSDGLHTDIGGIS